MDASEDEPIVLLLPELLLPPEVLGVVADEEPVDGDEAEEPDELVDGVLLEPLAPMEVPLPEVPVLALGVLLLELPLALGVELLELPEALGDELELELDVSVLLLGVLLELLAKLTAPLPRFKPQPAFIRNDRT